MDVGTTTEMLCHHLALFHCYILHLGLLLEIDWAKSKSNWILAHGFYWIWIKLDMDIHCFRSIRVGFYWMKKRDNSNPFGLERRAPHAHLLPRRRRAVSHAPLPSPGHHASLSRGRRTMSGRGRMSFSARGCWPSVPSWRSTTRM